MQALFSCVPATLDSVEAALSSARFGRYTDLADGDRARALRLYHWNARLCAALYWPLQVMEVAFRNAVAGVLVERYGSAWHTEPRLWQCLAKPDRRKLTVAVNRCGGADMPVGAVVADVNFGFWVSLLAGRYEVPLGWPTRLRAAFPGLPPGLERDDVRRRANDIRVLRNRIAHHEPILNRKLQDDYRAILDIIGWCSDDLRWVVEQTAEPLPLMSGVPS
jgi:hypothetical protein